jgi:hypothetical protein
MKSHPFYLILFCSFFFSSFSQKLKMTETTTGKEVLKTTKKVHSKKEVKPIKASSSYQVIEKVNMPFGGYTTTYEVSDLSQVNTYDLGPNNTREIIPHHTEIEPLLDIQKNKLSDSIKKTFTADVPNIMENSKKNNGYISINPLVTYERVAEKGYKSIEIFQKLGNAYFFNEKLKEAARWYAELFAMTTDLEPVYFYRYAKALRYIGENKKSDEMMNKFNTVIEKIQGKKIKIIIYRFF